MDERFEYFRWREYKCGWTQKIGVWSIAKNENGESKWDKLKSKYKQFRRDRAIEKVYFVLLWALIFWIMRSLECLNFILLLHSFHIFLNCVGLPLQFIVSSGALSCLLNLLTRNHKNDIKREACWSISNITAGNKAQIQVILS